MLVNCVRSIKKHEKNSDYEIIVVDDFSTKHNRDRLRQLAEIMKFKLVETEANLGFPRATNLGLTHASGDYLILCNNDVIFTNPVLERFEKAHLTQPRTAVVGCKLLYPDGTVQHGGVQFAHGRFMHTNGIMDATKSRYCIGVTFALCSVRREFYYQAGGLDPEFFIACDDSEYCLRAWRHDWGVYYDSSINAIHLEGATRGKTDHDKKKNPKWFDEEKKSIARLNANLHDLNILREKVTKANGHCVQTLKIEIGAGYNPQPGYEHIDARRLPHIEHVMDFAKDPLPYGDNTVDEILSNHSIEHASYRRLPFILKEWHRVLKAGGKVVLRTPDLEFICKTYLAGKKTPEWPDDEKFIENNLGEVSPAWWANIKLFAGQDYAGNFHYLCFDFKMLHDLLKKYGFRSIKKIDLTPVFSPGELQIEAFK